MRCRRFVRPPTFPPVKQIANVRLGFPHTTSGREVTGMVASGRDGWSVSLIREMGRTIRYALDRWHRMAALITLLIVLAAIVLLLGRVHS